MEEPKDTFDYSDCDYCDRFEEVISDSGNRIGIADVGGMFADPGPKWVSALMALRNRIVGCFGLKADAVPADGKPRVGVFEVLGQTDQTMILGEDDKHLDFRIQLSLTHDGGGDRKRVTVTTLVRYHNRLGHIYFFFVRPFHRMIVPAVMKRRLRQLAVRV
ncbi:MAG: DUF2867 domain-containing protein [Alistipes sp.]